MIRHYAEPEGRVIFDHRHDADERMVGLWGPAQFDVSVTLGHWIVTGERGWDACPVTPEDHADPLERCVPQQVHIVHLTAPVFRALANGDLAAATTVSPVPLSAYLAGPECRAVWQRRSQQVEENPASAAWVTGVIWDERHQVAVGRAGYHGPPDRSGMVEIGYAVDPAYRRRGYARAALEALLQRAAREPQVRTVRVTISPDNAASYQLASQYGFTEVGEQWDDQDGLEIIYEVDAQRG
jgi:RimJ/RimL family protein N-acetyltransferase